MIEQMREVLPKKRAHYWGSTDPDMVRFISFFALALILSACVVPPSAPVEVVVQNALPTPTLEPTFTPSPPPTSTPQPSPTATPAEPTPTPTSQIALSGRILDQDTDQPVSGATIRVGAATATTDAEGRYALTGLPPGQYVLSVTHLDYDPGLSSIFTLVAGQSLFLDLTIYPKDTSPYPKDPMLTNPLDPAGAPTARDAEHLARQQGLTGEATKVEETKLHGTYLVNYKRGGEVRAAVASLDHDAWVLTDAAGQTWWIIKVCGNLARLVPTEATIATPQPRSLPPLAEVLVEGVSVRACASETCAEVGTLAQGEQVEVFGCLTDGGWCQVGLPGDKKGWCTGKSLRQLAVAKAVPVLQAVLPTTAPVSPQAGEGKINSDCEEFKPGLYTQSMGNLIEAIVAGKPDYRNGAMVPLPICSSPQPRKLKITIESAISEAGTPLAEPPRFYLFRSLVWSIPDYIHSHNYVYANVEHDYTRNEGWSLEEIITPGLYLLFIEHDSYEDLINPRDSKDIPQSVTYRVEIADIP